LGSRCGQGSRDVEEDRRCRKISTPVANDRRQVKGAEVIGSSNVSHRLIDLFHLQEAFDAASQQVSQYEAEFREIGSVDYLVAEKTRIQDQMKAKKDVLKNLNVCNPIT